MDKEMYEQFEAQRRMQNENIEAQGEEQMKMYAPTMNEQMSQAQSAVLEQVNPKKVVRTILLELKGMEEVIPTNILKKLNKVITLKAKGKEKDIIQNIVEMDSYIEDFLKNDSETPKEKTHATLNELNKELRKIVLRK